MEETQKEDWSTCMHIIYAVFLHITEIVPKVNPSTYTKETSLPNLTKDRCSSLVLAMSPSLLSNSYQYIHIMKSLTGIHTTLQLPLHFSVFFLSKQLSTLSPLLPQLPLTTQSTLMLMISSILKTKNKQRNTLSKDHPGLYPIFQSPSKATYQQNLTYLVIPTLLKHFHHLSSKAFQISQFSLYLTSYIFSVFSASFSLISISHCWIL